ncbi:hypothetical protein BC829DRAFT_403669 [Chytridium lagenaria]|nr:hypothetical protein BC829DRAFT_403669 [Chytridium lagenaria]
MANTGENTAIGMIRSACMFGIGFPIMKSLSMLLNRRGLTVFDVKEPTNSAEEVESKKTTFRFIASQEIYWNTLTRLLLAEIRDNTTFSISVVCSHIVVLMTRIISAAAFRRLQMEKKGKTAPVLSDAYNQFQKKRVSQFERDPRQLSVERTYLENLKEEVVLPGYGDHQSISTVPKEPHRDSTGSGSIFVNVPKIDVSPPNLHFTPMSDDIRFAFTNLTSMFAEWCGRISAFLITLLLTSTPPQYTWTQCLGPLPASTHFVRGCIMILFSLTMDAVGLVVEHRVSKATLRDAIEEFQTTEVSWLVYFQMMLMASSLSGAVIMAMPGILENGNECYKEGRNIWI